MTEKRIRFFVMAATLVIVASIIGIRLLPYSFYRTREEQNKLYKKKKSQRDGYKKRSKHQDWLAIDFVIIRKGECVWHPTPEYEILGSIWEKLGGTWGGSWKTFKDIFHFEL